ncbi:uncharacterized protein Z518_03243 [Rhinocladiella mackenziei CBS 650.93]|uniref:L-ornithine N(5)-oxygenase n=1 Tax=Rhinocladiella mackenziei CBS 650.93 TaxID=1442369 RepID=A0A0D2G264_9EURO|nr:uncharacterized protein Z518_03243 [Rhinocladiella mackenziei CBS 650.93]KIX08587.1 hypothetical protein Z518_03243 [Rhinocladiella mackenziei CBS 650.93]
MVMYEVLGWRAGTPVVPVMSLVTSTNSASVPIHTSQNWDQSDHELHRYAASSEIQSYLKAVALHYRLDRFITFHNRVVNARWNGDCFRWTVTIEGGLEHESEILVNASGILNNPKLPDLNGLDGFEGDLAHTAAWDSRIDVTGKRVAIVGAGASAIQVLPALQPQASHIDIYIRTPSWITPPAGASFNNEHNHTYTEEEKAKFADDADYSLSTRKEMEASFNAMHGAFVKNSEKQREMRSRMESRMKQLIHSEELQTKLIPSFEAGCRRLNPGEKYLEALQQNNVDPIFEAIQTVTSNGIRDISGNFRPVDTIIAATGFDTSFRPRFPIIGTDGNDLRDLWKDEPASYCGLAVSGFPNYLIFLGPNTPIANGSLMGALEGTADFFVRLIQKMSVQQALSFNVRQAVQDDFNHHAQRVMQNLVWTGSCRSWFKNSRGRVTAVWPGSGLHYREFLQSDRWEDWEWRYDTNRFAYWNLGYSRIETEMDPDLSYYIRQHPNLPLEALLRVHNEQDSRSVERADSHTHGPSKVDIESGRSCNMEDGEGDCRSDESASSGYFDGSQSEASDVKASQLDLLIWGYRV